MLFFSPSPGADVLRQVFSVQTCVPTAFWLTKPWVLLSGVTGRGQGHPSATVSRVHRGHLAQPGLCLKPVGGPPKAEVPLVKHSSFALQDP